MEGRKLERRLSLTKLFGRPPKDKPPSPTVTSPTGEKRPPLPAPLVRAQSSLDMRKNPHAQNVVMSNSMENLFDVGIQVKQDKKTLVVQELIETEYRYVEDLTFTIQGYLIPLEESHILTSEQIKRLFSNLVSIRDLNQQLANELFKYEKGETLESIGDIFLRMAGFFKIYVVYCTNNQNSISEYDKLMKEHEEFGSFVKGMQSMNEHSRKLFLSDYLIKPVQRITKYPLFVQELLKCTSVEDKEYLTLTKLHAQLTDINKYVNSRAHHHESLQKVVEIAQKLKSHGRFMLVTPSRHYVQEAKFKVYINGKKSKEYVFLFSDGMLFVEDKESFIFKRFLLLDSFIKPVETIEENSFELVDENGLTQTVYKMVTVSNQVKKSWIEEIKRIRDGKVQVEERLLKAAETETKRRTWHMETKEQAPLSPGRSRCASEPSTSPLSKSNGTTEKVEVINGNEFSSLASLRKSLKYTKSETNLNIKSGFSNLQLVSKYRNSIEPKEEPAPVVSKAPEKAKKVYSTVGRSHFAQNNKEDFLAELNIKLRRGSVEPR